MRKINPDNHESIILNDLVSQDQAERNDYAHFIRLEADGDYDQGALIYADIKHRHIDDIFGDKERLNTFMGMEFDFDIFTDDDWDRYWLLTQHCDFNIDFQKQALDVIKKYIGVDNNHYKYLYDRIECALTGEQKYGTQVICCRGQYDKSK